MSPSNSNIPLFPIIFIFLLIFPISSAQIESLCSDDEDCTDPQHPSSLVANPYPSIHMSRYNLIREFYPAFRFLANCYFALVNALFSLYNSFQPIENVNSWQNEEGLLSKYSIQQTRNMIGQGQIKCTDLLNELIGRINGVYKLTKALAFNNYEKARKMAEEMDERISKMKTGEMEKLFKEKPLFGIPFTTMANIEQEELAINACNSNLNNEAPNENALIVQRVLDAGGILLGISAIPNRGLSWAGDDSACGQVNNPHDSRRIPGGSASGEGAIIAVGGSFFGIGNDVGGSLLIPAHMCGIMALKPTNFPNHTVPSDGIWPAPENAQMVTNGPLFRQAEDLPILLSVMANKSIDEFTMPVDFGSNFKLFYFEEIDVLLGESLHSEQRNAVKAHFERKYNLSVQKVQFPLMNRLFEFWGLSFWGQNIPRIYPDLFNQFMDIFGANPGTKNDTFLSLELNIVKNFVIPRDAKVSSKLAKLRKQVIDLLAQNGALLGPIWPTPAPFHHMEPFTPFNFYYTQIWNLLGMPALAMPTGKSALTNMPNGVQFVASPFNEALLASIAVEMEENFGGWVKPGDE